MDCCSVAPSRLVGFRLEQGLPVWSFEFDGIAIEKRLVMPHGQNTVLATYRRTGGPLQGRLELEPWIIESKRSLIASFATGIAKDKAAVHAAIMQPWSNGQVEAQITKLKLVKRQMYGRAKLDLLQARLIGAP